MHTVLERVQLLTWGVVMVMVGKVKRKLPSNYSNGEKPGRSIGLCIFAAISNLLTELGKESKN